MLRKYIVKSLRVLRLASQLMLCTSKWPQVPPAECLYHGRRIHVSTAWISISPQVATHLTVPIIFSTLICLFIIQLLITCVKFLVDRFMGYGVLIPPKLPFPIDLLRRPYNSVALPCDTVIISKSYCHPCESLDGISFRCLAEIASMLQKSF